MAFLECAGSTLLGFGPPFVMFLVTIAPDPVRIIIMIVSAFFWLMSLLASGILWFAVVPLRDQLEFGVFFSVLFQEVFRLLLYLLLHKAEKGLRQVAGGSVILADNHRDMMAYVCGFGYGVMSGAFGLVNVIRDCWGPGTVGLRGGPIEFFPTSAALALAFVLLHTCWGIIFFHGIASERYIPVGMVVASHFLVTGLTFLNTYKPPLYHVSIPITYIVLCGMAGLAFYMAGGSVNGLKEAFSWRRSSPLLVRVPEDDDDGGFGASGDGAVGNSTTRNSVSKNGGEDAKEPTRLL